MTGRSAATGTSPRWHAIPGAGSLLGVTVGVGLLVVVNAVVREPSGGLAGGHFVGPPALPVVQMLKPGDWRCPGPLPVGAGAESSRISIVNSGPSAVNLLLVVSRTGLPKRGVSAGASISRERFKVDRYSQAVVPLTTGVSPDSRRCRSRPTQAASASASRSPDRAGASLSCSPPRVRSWPARAGLCADRQHLWRLGRPAFSTIPTPRPPW